jgi:hypothetical protein
MGSKSRFFHAVPSKQDCFYHDFMAKVIYIQKRYTVKPVHNGIIGARTIFRCRHVSVVDRFVNFSIDFEKLMLNL